MIRTVTLIAGLGLVSACMPATDATPGATPGAPPAGEFDALNTGSNPLCDTSAERANRPRGSLAGEDLDPALCDFD